MIHKVKVLMNWRNLNKGLVLEPRPLTVLVGDSGSGKSSLLSLMNTGGLYKGIRVADMKVDGSVLKYDSSHNDTRLFTENNRFSSSLRDACLSHGQASWNVFKKIAKSVEPGSVILIDEPESGISLCGINRLSDMILDWSSDKMVIVATNHPYLMKMSTEIYSMGDGWIRSRLYVDRYRRR